MKAEFSGAEFSGTITNIYNYQGGLRAILEDIITREDLNFSTPQIYLVDNYEVKVVENLQKKDASIILRNLFSGYFLPGSEIFSKERGY